MKNKIHSGQNKGFLLLCGAITLGILIGAVYATVEPVKNPFLHQYFLPECSGGTIYEVFRNTFLSLGIFTVVSFFIGLSAFGQPAGLLMLIYRGFGIGMAVSSVYLSKGIHGISTVFVLILPACIAIIIISLLAVREIMRFSKSIFMFMISDNSHTEKSFRMYCLEFFVLVIFSFVIAVFATVMNYIFSGLR